MPDAPSRARRPYLVVLVAVSCVTLAVVACGGKPPSSAEPAAKSASPPPPAESAAAAKPAVVFLGDSLTAGLGLGEEEAYPALVGEALAADGLDVRIVNAGVSGDTTAGGLARLDWLLTQRPAVVVVALGANDGLRAQPLATIESTLDAIVERSLASGARVVLAGMKMPPNYGPEYTAGFEAIYPRLAKKHGLSLVPFLLDGVAAVAELNQADGIHPTAEGQRRVAALVVPVLEPVVREALAGSN